MNNRNKEEAERWLSLAEKLLEGRDLVGCKTFAIRARESDPRLEHADLILAVVDTLMAGQSRVLASSSMHDWYAVLQLSRLTRDPELISIQYQKLAMMLHPQRNRLPFAEDAFQLVNEAWAVLSSPSKKWFYDNELTLLDSAASTQLPYHHLQPHPQPVVQMEPPPQQQLLHPYEQSFRKNSGSGNVSVPTEPTHPSVSVPSSSVSTRLNMNVNVPSQPESASVNAKTNSGVPSQPGTSRGNKIGQNEPTRLNVPIQGESTPVNVNAPPSESESAEDAFWTACPYCYSLFEYPRVYEECTLRCQNCRRAFHGVVVPSPPVNEAGRDGSFCCWGFIPLGFSENDYRNQAKNAGGVSSWNPFSPMFVCPVGSVNPSGSKAKNANQRNPRPKAIIIDEDAEDVLLELSDASDESDVDWDSHRENKKAKNAKGKSPAKSAKRGPVEKIKNLNKKVADQAKGSTAVNSHSGSVNKSVGETRQKAAGNGSSSVTRRQSGRHAKELGKLDLNVEFSNEVEAPVTGDHGGHGGPEDNIEGIGFFEGLDEFLSSLPILSAVGGDDKVKAA